MNNNILPSFDETTYETHFLSQQNLPFIFHKDTIVHQGNRCTPNLHLNLELLYFVDGVGSVICDGKAFAVQKGDLVVINSCEIHTVTTATDFVQYYCLIVDNDFCAANVADMSELQFASSIQNHKAQALFEQVIQELVKIARGKTLIAVTHDERLAKYFDKVIDMNDMTDGRKDVARKEVV